MSDHIPLEILHRLPVKSIVKFIAVCKSWKSIITSPTFISDNFFRRATHISSNLPDTRRRIFISTCPTKSRKRKESEFSENPNIYSLRYDDDSKLLQESVILEGPHQILSSRLQPLNVCNGLVCLTDHVSGTDVVLWNPAIQKFISIPPPQVYNWVYDFVGFGFDSKANDFKVVGVFTHLKVFRSFRRVPLVSPVVKVYSLAKRAWKDHRGLLPERALIEQHNPQPFINGAVHWVGVLCNGHYRCVILCFDLSKEVFGEIMLPQNFEDSKSIFVVGREESLALVRERFDPISSDIWVMKEYGVHDSWTKVFTFSLNEVELKSPLSGPYGFWSLPKVLLFRRCGDLLLMVKSKYLCLLDLETGDHKDLGPVGDGTHLVDYFVESLFLLIDQ